MRSVRCEGAGLSGSEGSPRRRGVRRIGEARGGDPSAFGSSLDSTCGRHVPREGTADACEAWSDLGVPGSEDLCRQEVTRLRPPDSAVDAVAREGWEVEEFLESMVYPRSQPPPPTITF